MCTYKMNAKELILTSGSSKGSQIKFFKDDYWYKIDEYGPEGKSEWLASELLKCSTLENDEFVKYEMCKIEYEGKTYNGCRSKSFLKPGEHFFSYEKIYQMMTGNLLSEDIIPLNSPEERINFTVNMIKNFCGLDVRDYIAKNLSIDMFLLNTDRHFNNLGIIVDSSMTSFRNAPIFDNGASFLSNYNVYPPFITTKDIDENNIPIIARPFSADFEYQAVSAGINVKFNFSKINSLISKLPDDRMKSILKYQVSKYESILNIEQNGGPGNIESEINGDYDYNDDGFDPADD